MKALLYCVKSKPYLLHHTKSEYYSQYEYDYGYELYDANDFKEISLNGKIVAEVEIDKVEEIYNGFRFGDDGRYYVTNYMSYGMVLEKSCLTDKEIEKYLQEDIGYALHLTNLKVFDKPLSFDKDYIYKDYKTNATLTKAPQNMCNVYDRFGNKYVLISIQPQHLCNILNGKKTIEVRRKIISPLKNLMED